MLNLARRLHSRRPQSETDIRELPARAIVTDWKTVERHDEEWQTLLTEDLLHGSGAERFFDQVCLRLESEEEPEMVQACGMAAAAASLVDVPPRVMAWLEKLLREKPTDLLIRSASYSYKKIRSRQRGHSKG
jgi:FMN phosphatase YigB (HAD superfamily)